MEQKRKKVIADIFKLMAIIKNAELISKDLTHEQIVDNLILFRKQLGLIGYDVSFMISPEEEEKKIKEKEALGKAISAKIAQKLGVKELPGKIKVDVA